MLQFCTKRFSYLTPTIAFSHAQFSFFFPEIPAVQCIKRDLLFPDPPSCTLLVRAHCKRPGRQHSSSTLMQFTETLCGREVLSQWKPFRLCEKKTQHWSLNFHFITYENVCYHNAIPPPPPPLPLPPPPHPGSFYVCDPGPTSVYRFGNLSG